MSSWGSMGAVVLPAYLEPGASARLFAYPYFPKRGGPVAGPSPPARP
jgi:hypothetical protein